MPADFCHFQLFIKIKDQHVEVIWPCCNRRYHAAHCQLAKEHSLVSLLTFFSEFTEYIISCDSFIILKKTICSGQFKIKWNKKSTLRWAYLVLGIWLKLYTEWFQKTRKGKKTWRKHNSFAIFVEQHVVDYVYLNWTACIRNQTTNMCHSMSSTWNNHL